MPTARAVSTRYSSEGYDVALTSSGIVELIELFLGADKFWIKVTLWGYFFHKPVRGLKK